MSDSGFIGTLAVPTLPATSDELRYPDGLVPRGPVVGRSIDSSHGIRPPESERDSATLIAEMSHTRNGQRQVRISFFGNFGQGNLGNEGTLRAILDNLREALPDTAMNCICTGPEATRATHHIPAIPIHQTFLGSEVLRSNRFARLIRKLFLGAPIEFYRWIQAFRSLRNTDMLIVPGTQLLSDTLTGPWGGPYVLFRWSLAAKLRRCKLVFASVGVGPLRHPFSKFFVKTALRLADFRSYRDNISKDYLRSVGFNSHDDPVYPDLAFSLPVPASSPGKSHPRDRTVVALGLLDHYGQLGPLSPGLSPEETYRYYVERMASFASWLLEHGYTVRFVIGDMTYDREVLADVQNVLRQKGIPSEDQLIAEPIESLEDLISQLAESDIVVSPRFHNIVFGLLLNRPVIAISYHEKFSALLESLHLARFNVPIECADRSEITERFCELAKDREQLKRTIAQNVGRHRASLNEQYMKIVNLLDLR